MYVPRLRGRAEELRALREAAPALRRSGRIVPLVEPAAGGSRLLLEVAAALDGLGVPLAILFDPDGRAAGRLPGAVPAAAPGVRPALRIARDTPAALVDAFLAAHAGRPPVLVHRDAHPSAARWAAREEIAFHVVSAPLPALPRSVCVPVRDVLVRRARNADYADAPDEPFTDAHLTFAREGFAGFGDFATVGDAPPSDRPQRLHTAAVHLTYPTPESAVRIRRAVSTPTGTPGDAAGKIGEALIRLLRWIDEESACDWRFSTAIPQWRRAVETMSFPAPGMLKRQSLRHHLELMAALLGGEG